MSLRQTNLNLVGIIAFVGLLGNVGCGGESPTPPVESAATEPGVERGAGSPWRGNRHCSRRQARVQ